MMSAFLHHCAPSLNSKEGAEQSAADVSEDLNRFLSFLGIVGPLYGYTYTASTAWKGDKTCEFRYTSTDFNGKLT